MKQINFKGTIGAVRTELNEIAKEYDGWTVEQFIGLASLNKGVISGQQQQKF